MNSILQKAPANTGQSTPILAHQCPLEKQKDEQFASQVSFGPPAAARKESFDRDYDTKTAENTNQKELTLSEILISKLLKGRHPDNLKGTG